MDLTIILSDPLRTKWQGEGEVFHRTSGKHSITKRCPGSPLLPGSGSGIVASVAAQSYMYCVMSLSISATFMSSTTLAQRHTSFMT